MRNSSDSGTLGHEQCPNRRLCGAIGGREQISNRELVVVKQQGNHNASGKTPKA